MISPLRVVVDAALTGDKAALRRSRAIRARQCRCAFARRRADTKPRSCRHTRAAVSATDSNATALTLERAGVEVRT